MDLWNIDVLTSLGWAVMYRAPTLPAAVVWLGENFIEHTTINGRDVIGWRIMRERRVTSRLGRGAMATPHIWEAGACIVCRKRYVYPDTTACPGSRASGR